MTDTDQQLLIGQLRERIQTLESVIRRLEGRDAITRILSESTSVRAAARPVLQALCALFDWNAGCFWIPDNNAAKLRCIALSTNGDFPNFSAASERSALPVGVGLAGRVWLSAEPACIVNLERDDNFPRSEAAAKDGLCSALAFPVMSGDELAGVVELFSIGKRELDRQLLEMFTAIGRQIGLFMQKRRAEKQLSQQARIAALRADVASSLTRTGDFKSILAGCTDALVKHLNVAFARIWTLNAAGRTLELQASSGLYTHIDGGHSRIPVGAFKIGWIAEKRRAHLTNSVPNDPRVTDQAWAAREGMQAFAGYPLMTEERLMGVVAMFSRHTLEDFELGELAPIADAIAQFLDRRRVDEDLRTTQALNSAILQTAFDAIVAMDETGRIVEFNPAAEAMFGYQRQHVVGRALADVIVPAQLRDAHRIGLARYLSTGETRILGRRIEVVAMRAGGGEFPVELAVARIPGDGPPMFTAYIRSLRVARDGAVTNRTE